MAPRRALLLAWLAVPLGARAGTAERLKWRQLMPPGWSAASYFAHAPGEGMRDLSDADPRARALLDELIALGRNAPPLPALQGRQVRIAGFVMPLAQPGDAIKRFLLVPYQGACVHTPPPPANQAIIVEPKTALDAALAPYPVWVQGRLELRLERTPHMHAAYRLQAAVVERFDSETDRAWLGRYSPF